MKQQHQANAAVTQQYLVPTAELRPFCVSQTAVTQHNPVLNADLRPSQYWLAVEFALELPPIGLVRVHAPLEFGTVSTCIPQMSHLMNQHRF